MTRTIVKTVLITMVLVAVMSTAIMPTPVVATVVVIAMIATLIAPTVMVAAATMIAAIGLRRAAQQGCSGHGHQLPGSLFADVHNPLLQSRAIDDRG